jgi:hypothetical protein
MVGWGTFVNILDSDCLPDPLPGLRRIRRSVIGVLFAELARLESRPLPLGVRDRSRFTGKGMTPLPGLRATLRTLDFHRVHTLSLRRISFGNY